LDHERVVELVGDVLGEPDAGPRTVRRRPPGPAQPPRAVLRHRPTEQAHLVLGGPGIARADDRRFVASVLNQALGGSMASRLFQEVRERRGLVYSVYSYTGMHVDAGTFAIYAGTAPHRVDEVLRVVRGELRTLVDGGLFEAELARAKGHLVGSTVLALEDTGSRMNRLGKALTTDTQLLSLDETIAAVEAVSADDVLTLARQLLAGPFTLAVVGPFEDADRGAFERWIQPDAA
ncbi:MAG TPA: pitrilysin family protein, partial [Egibacteraceae bacterium]|nr:pitrilysin family protein [Egibacteraceae bacterium]